MVGDVSELIEATQKHRLVVTGFCDWKTTGISVQKRLELWSPLAGTPGDEFGLQELIDTSSLPLPAVNAGVLGFHRDSPIMDEWQRLTEFGRDTFLPDEVALQLLLPRYQHFLLGSQFNCSPAFGPYVRDVRIWHFVADRTWDITKAKNSGNRRTDEVLSGRRREDADLVAARSGHG